MNRLVVRTSFWGAGLLFPLAVVGVAAFTIYFIAMHGGCRAIPDVFNNADRNTARIFFWALLSIPAAPFFLYLSFRALTSRVVLTDEGIVASARVGFGRLRLRGGATPLLPWAAVRRVSPILMEVDADPRNPYPYGREYRTVLTGILVEGRQGESRWRVDLTKGMEPWGDAVVFVLDRVGEGVEDPALRRCLPPDVRARLKPYREPQRRTRRSRWSAFLLGRH